jgi:hypothetical protein
VRVYTAASGESLLQGKDRCREGSAKLVLHFAYRGSSHRRKGAAGNGMVHLSILVRGGGGDYFQMIFSCLLAASRGGWVSPFGLYENQQSPEIGSTILTTFPYTTSILFDSGCCRLIISICTLYSIIGTLRQGYITLFMYVCMDIHVYMLQYAYYTGVPHLFQLFTGRCKYE